jgi:hypothetical protein
MNPVAQTGNSLPDLGAAKLWIISEVIPFFAFDPDALGWENRAHEIRVQFNV